MKKMREKSEAAFFVFGLSLQFLVEMDFALERLHVDNTSIIFSTPNRAVSGRFTSIRFTSNYLRLLDELRLMRPTINSSIPVCRFKTLPRSNNRTWRHAVFLWLLIWRSSIRRNYKRKKMFKLVRSAQAEHVTLAGELYDWKCCNKHVCIITNGNCWQAWHS